MHLAAALYRMAAGGPDPLRRILHSDRLRSVRSLVSSHPPLVTGPINYEGHTFDFTAPVAIFDRAQRKGIENRICRLILSEVSPGATTVDVGANYGYLTRVMAVAAGEEGRVVSFEANEGIASVLRTALADNGTSWVEVVGKAVGVGKLQALDAYMPALTDVALVKIDVDGPEFDVLTSARTLLERDHPVVIVEMNQQHQEIHDLLSAVGYTHFMGMSNEPLVTGTWPANLIASTRPVSIPRV